MPEPSAPVYGLYFVLSGSYLGIAILVHLANRTRAINQAVSLLLISTGIWALAAGFIHSGFDTRGNFVRPAVASSGLIVSGFWILWSCIRDTGREFRAVLKSNTGLYVGVLVYGLLVFSPWFIPYASTEVTRMHGVLRTPLQYISFLPIIMMVYQMLKGSKNLIGTAKFEANIVGIGGCLTVALVLLRNIFRDVMPLDISPAWSGIVVGIFLAVLLYGMLTRQILDSKTLAIKATRFILAVTLTIAAVELVRNILLWGNISSAISHSIAGLVGIATWVTIRKFIRRVWRARPSAKYQKISESIQQLEPSSDPLAVTLRKIELLVSNSLGIDRCNVAIETESGWIAADPKLEISSEEVEVLTGSRWANLYSLERSWQSDRVKKLTAWLKRAAVETATVSSQHPRVLLLVGEQQNRKAHTFAEIDQLISISEVIRSWASSLRSARRNRDMGKLNAVPMVAAGLGHDLKQYAASFMLYAELMETHSNLTEFTQRHLPRFRQQVNRLTSLSTQLSQMGRERELEVQIKPVEALLTELKEELNPLVSGELIRIHWQTRGALGEFRSDHDLLIRALRNLCLNALEVLEEQGEGTLRISTRRVRGELEIEVVDSGPGLPDEVRKHLFEPFVNSRKVNGSGLGLYLAWDSIIKIGGTITCEDVSPTGTRFNISLPEISDTGSWPTD